MAPSDLVRQEDWVYLDGEIIAGDSNHHSANLPNTSGNSLARLIVELDAEGGDFFYRINHPGAGPNAPGFVPENGARIIGPLQNWEQLTVYGTAGVLHLMYYKPESA